MKQTNRQDQMTAIFFAVVVVVVNEMERRVSTRSS